MQHPTLSNERSLPECCIPRSEFYMRRCLQLAAHGLGRVRPNPMVGCVVVLGEQIISEGYHQYHGGNHAERNALLRLKEQGLWGDALHDATLYVNLEPCSHFGLTPPCADLIIESGIRTVCAGNPDPNPLVAGRGFARLEAAGVRVEQNILAAEGEFLNRRFFTFQRKKRPYIILKWAVSSDGFMAPDPTTNQSYWLSSPTQNQRSHQWRTQEAAILVGSQTYLLDQPQLNARHFHGLNPRPIVLDRSHRLHDVPPHWLHLDSPTLSHLMDTLFHEKIQSVIVEGGRKILDAFIAEGLYDEVRILHSSKSLSSGLQAPPPPPPSPHTGFPTTHFF